MLFWLWEASDGTVSTTQTSHPGPRTATLRIFHRVTPRLRDEEGVRFGLAHAWLVVAALFAAAIGVSRPVSFALLAATALAGGHALAAHWRLGITLAAWAIWTGFFENTLGLLTFSVPDVGRLVLLVLLAAVLERGRSRRPDGP
ncbi:MAG: hypothetical protein JWQ93_2295 [Marmoricola sp.]|jgi:hypothetical protein|nr:hypothetical protein [Marmoricola sp.]MCW2837955.1 hypothetical protein [Marmoricola sp.]